MTETTTQIRSRSIYTRKRKRRPVEETSVAKKQKILNENTIEKILGCRETENGREFLVKYKNKSYLATEWVTKSFIESYERGAQQIIRFLKNWEETEGVQEYFDPNYCIVERVIGESQSGDSKLYFVKWTRLPYADCTWEEESVIPKEKIEEYKRFNEIPEDTKFKRPSARSWKKLEESPKYKGNNQLRPYQLEGLNWLRFCWYNRRSTILGDEMGLGKTIQAAMMINYLFTKYKLRGPFLVVAPLSTLTHWKREFDGWTDMNAVIFHGSAESRNIIFEYEWYYTKKRKDLYKFNVLITSYEMVMAESSILGKIHWKYLVVDEGHRLKNKNSKLLSILKKFTVDHKLLLTGTPIQNNMEELWSLLNFLEPEKFGSSSEFLKKFGDLKNYDQVQELHKLIEPYLLRRLKEDVEKTIPIKEEIIVDVVPTKIQKQYYRAIMDKNRKFLQKGVKKKQNIPKLINVLICQRQICNHPFLIPGAEEALCKGMSPDEVNEFMIRCSSKLVLLDKLLAKLREGKHKVLIFSQMVQVLHILEDYLNYRNYTYLRLDGSIRGDKRQESIDKFNDPNEDYFVFLISTRAGGVGINLTAADTVIIYDSDWNPQNDIQAQARCHRIGQTKEVKVYRLLTKGTKEKELFERASKKLGLDRVVLGVRKDQDSMEIDLDGAEEEKKENKLGLKKEEIEMLLRHGAYSAFNEDDTEEKMLLEDDIDSILKRNATVIRYQEEGEKGFSSFSKASFCADESDMQIDIEDEDFWNKYLPKHKDPKGLLDRLEIDEELNTEEKKNEFMKDLEYCVQEQIEAFDKFQYYDTDTLEEVLTKVLYSNFTSKQREQAQQWLNQISGRKAEKEKKDKEEEVVKVQKKTTNSHKKDGWFKAERDRLYKTLMQIEWGDWEKLHETNTNHTVEEIQSFAESFVMQCMKIIPEEFQKTLQQIIDSTSEPVNGLLDKEHQSLSVSPIKVKAIQNITITLPQNVTDAKLDIIRLSKDDNKIVRTKDMKDLKEIISFPVPGIPGEYKILLTSDGVTFVSDTITVEGCHPLLEDADWISKASKQLQRWIKMRQFDDDLNEIFLYFGEELKIIDSLPSDSFKISPAPWWDADTDRDLLRGVRKHGKGKFTSILEDEEFCFKEKASSFLGKSRKRTKELQEYPSDKILNSRVLKLMELLLQLKKMGVKEVKSKDELCLRVTDKWTKKEKSDIQKGVLIYGLCLNDEGEPQWHILRNKCKLKKTPEAVEKFINEELLPICNKGEKTDYISMTTAKKIVQRVEVQKKLYKIVYPKMEKLRQNVQRVSKSKSQLPVWWTSEHDIALLEGVKIHGFNFKNLFEDKKFKCFAQAKNLKEFSAFPREGICVNRLEKMILFVEKMDELGTPKKISVPVTNHVTTTKRKPEEQFIIKWLFTPKGNHVILEDKKEEKKIPRIEGRQLCFEEYEPEKKKRKNSEPRVVKKASKTDRTIPNGIPQEIIQID